MLEVSSVNEVILYRYQETNLIFHIDWPTRLVHCWDIDEPKTDILKGANMAQVLESHNVSIVDFKSDFGGLDLSLSDMHVMDYIEVDGLKPTAGHYLYEV